MRLNEIRKDNPLIICMTNDVVKNFTANGLLALGASPAMAEAKEEMDAFLSVAGALLINIGSLHPSRVEDMREAVKYANKHQVPVVLDPVASGASSFRKTFCLNLLNDFNISVIRGNASELLALLEETSMKGTDSRTDLNNIEIAKRAHEQFGAAVVITGEVDTIVQDNRVALVKNGTPLLTKVTGGGCLLGAVVASFVYNKVKPTLEDLTEALATYTVASEFACKLPNGTLPGHFAVHLIDQLYEVTEDDIVANQRVEEV